VGFAVRREEAGAVRGWPEPDEARFDSGAAVTLEEMKAHGLAQKKGIPVKVLAKGELTKPLTVHAHAFSKSAREAIEQAGGTCQVIEG